MEKLRWIGRLGLLFAALFAAVPQASAGSPNEPLAFCVCCYFKFMDGGTYCYYYAHDCVEDQWIGYTGPPDTPITQGVCAMPCPGDCVSDPLPPQPYSGTQASGTAALEPQLAPSLAGGPGIYIWRGNGVHDKVRRAGLAQAIDPAQALKLEADPQSPYEAQLLDECWAQVKLPKEGNLKVRLALVAVRAKLNAQVLEVEGVKAPTKVLAVGWEVKNFPANVEDNRVAHIKSRHVIAVGPSGEKTRTLWLNLPAGDFQVLLASEVDVP